MALFRLEIKTEEGCVRWDYICVNTNESSKFSGSRNSLLVRSLSSKNKTKQKFFRGVEKSYVFRTRNV